MIGLFGVIVARHIGQALFSKSFNDLFTHKGVHRCNDRNSKEHSGDAEKISEQERCGHGENGNKPDLVSNYHRIKDVSVKLLENENDHKEPNKFLRLSDQNNKTCGNGADKGPKNGIILVTPAIRARRG